MIDLQQISVALNLATNRSLLIIDEFGKGTDPHGKLQKDVSQDSELNCIPDGAGLAAGVFNHLIERGDQCPKVLGATHFHGMFGKNNVYPAILTFVQRYSRAASSFLMSVWRSVTLKCV
jgi:DNA mismatch repair protein MSH5